MGLVQRICTTLPLRKNHNDMNKLRSLVEYNLFGVCSYLGEKFNIASSKIRLYFIYLSFLTFGSPVIFYFFLVFWMNMRRYMQNMKRNPLWNA